MDTEVELKLAVEPQFIDKLKQHPILLPYIAELKPQHLRNWYFDTSTFSLSEFRLAIRIREVEKRFIQTVKTAGSSAGGLHQREEFEAEIAYPELDINKVSSPNLRSILNSLASDLKVVFTTDFCRETILLPYHESLIELAIDQGAVSAKLQSVPISEIELELKKGDPKDIFALAKELAGKVPLQIHEVSKAGRGYQLASAEQCTFADAVINDSLPVSEVFRDIFSSQLSRLLSAIVNWQQHQSQSHFFAFFDALITQKDLIWLFKSAVSRSSSTEIRSQMMDVIEDLEPLEEQCRYGLWLSELQQLRLGDLDSQQTLLAWAKSYKHIKDWNQLVPLINDIVFGVPMGQMLIALSEWIYIQPWLEHDCKRHQRHWNRPLSTYLERWFDEHWQDVEDNIRELRDEDAGWQGPQQRIVRLIRLSEYWEDLYKPKKFKRFIAPWLDLVAGADEMNRLKWLEHKVGKLESHEQGEVLEWLKNERGACLTAIKQTMDGLQKVKPFWH